MKLSTIAFCALASLVAASSGETTAPSTVPQLQDAPLPESIVVLDVHATESDIFLRFQDRETGKQGVAALTFEQAAQMGLIKME